MAVSSSTWTDHKRTSSTSLLLKKYMYLTKHHPIQQWVLSSQHLVTDVICKSGTMILHQPIFLTETIISFRVTGTSASSIRVFSILWDHYLGLWSISAFLSSFVNSAYMLCTRTLPLTYYNPEIHQPCLGPTLTILSTRP